jgi:hypothetical protein
VKGAEIWEKEKVSSDVEEEEGDKTSPLPHKKNIALFAYIALKIFDSFRYITRELSPS